ncbi:MAG TPA: SAM-dependent methyltransferase, partial [Enhygromyxa sp.]|nr:SAM-dependent methyltransferase [Enhygromyxa sp.]
MVRRSGLLALVWLVLGCRTASPEPSMSHEPSTEPDEIDAAAIVAAADRDPADREADARRKPVELLEFLRLEPGMKVADIGAGFGYTTELLARAVGPTGRVYGQNTPFVLDRFARDGWTDRLAKPINQNVVSLEREFVDPFPDD